MGHQIHTWPVGDAATCGDFAEHLYLDPHRSVMFVGDVAGRGPEVGEAALALRSFVRSRLVGDTSLPACLNAVDEFFEQSLLSDAVPFASLIVAILDDQKLECRYASAGHEPALLFDAHGQCRDLAPTGPVLGLRALLGVPEFCELSATLELAGLLVMVTDGITEARRPAKDGAQSFFGASGVVRAVREARPRLQDTAQAILRAAALHARGELDDDASIAVATFGSGEKSTAYCVPEATIGGWDTLTRAERRVAKLIADGHTNRSIASELVVSESTVATHLRSIFGKLGVASRVQLTVAIMHAQRYVQQPVVA